MSEVLNNKKKTLFTPEHFFLYAEMIVVPIINVERLFDLKLIPMIYMVYTFI